MPFGITSSGFIIKRLADIKAELETLYRSTFGAGIVTTPDTVFGKLISIQSEREMVLWELLESIYNSAYPNTASDIHLDRVAEITAIVRNGATASTVTAYMAGTNATAIPVGTLFSVQDSGAIFKTLSLVNLSGSNFSISAITESTGTATATATAHGQSVDDFLFINNADQDEYNGLIQILTVADANTFTYAVTGSPATATGTIDADPATAVSCESNDTGEIEALAGTLTNVVNNISGLDSVDNYLDAIKGNNAETDAEFRERRINALTGVAAARLEGIRAYLLLVTNVTSAKVFENTTNAVDASGRPAKSIECLVIGGTDQDVLDSVFDRKAAGIKTYGSTSGTVTDTQGTDHTVYFSRPTSISIYLELDLTVDADYPSNGDDLVEQAILDHADTLEIGEDVIVYPYLIAAFGDIAGITDVVLRVGLATSPTLDNNITIDDVELAVFDSSRITIAQV